MRRSALKAIALVVAVAPTAYGLAGCEDGPNQPYSPSQGTASNNGGPDASTSNPGTQDFDAGGGGTNAVNVCNAAEQAAQWGKAFSADIKPPFSIGGLDLTVGNTFGTVTIEDLIHGTNGQPKLCQGQNAGFCLDGTPNPAYAWGAQSQLYLCYDAATHSVASTFEQVTPGYDGQLKFTLPKTVNGAAVPLAVDDSGAPADLNFVIDLRNEAMTLNGKTLTGANNKPLWDPSYRGGGGGMEDTRAQQMYLGLMYTYQPTLVAVTDGSKSPPLTELTDPNATTCYVSTKCRSGNYGTDGNYGVRPVGIYFDVGNEFSPDPATAATPVDIYMYPAKFEPYSLAPYNQGLDAFVSPSSDPNLTVGGKPVYGPYAAAGILSPTGATPFCTLYMGETWKDFVSNCVNVSGDPNIDATSLKKLLGGQHHTEEWFTFSVFGVNQNFSADAAQLTQNGKPGVLQDNVQTPADDSVATDFILDVRSSGDQLNDMLSDKSPGSQDLHGSAVVYAYYRALIQDAIHAEMAKVGMTPNPNPMNCWAPPGADLDTWVAPAGCTGFESLATPAKAQHTPPTLWTDYLDRGTKIAYASVFKPGDPTVKFLNDPTDAKHTTSNAFITQGNLLQGSLQQVVRVLGHGDVQNLPPATRDWRFYLIVWAQAYLGYSINRSKFTSTGLTWVDLYNDHLATTHTLRQVDTDNLFFDLQNGIDKFEYVDHSIASTIGAPLDFEYDVLLNSTNVQNFNYYARLDRDEAALYASMLEDKTQTPGSNENVNISDVFGSPAIANAGVSAASATHDAWYCATHGTPTTPDSDCTNGPPSDANGNMLLDGEGKPLFTTYHGIFTGTPFTIGYTPTDAQGNPQPQIPETEQMPYIASTIVALPNLANPYDTTSTNTPLTTIVTPWIPFQPGNGFEVPINGQRSQFVQTGSMDFSGVTITTNVDYTPVKDKNGVEIGGNIVAVETQDFLGEVFPCVDAGGDILRVRMYTSVLDILSWLETHPHAQKDCNISIRYSPYNNYPDVVTSLTNGVMLNVNPGAAGGPGRIGDVTLFNPSALTQTQ
jgi:hypothetical protein